jgi:ABC-type cobalamin transport system permease subunit
MRRLPALLSVASAAFIASAVAAHAQQGRTQVGVLECRGGPNVGMIIGSVTNLGCVFRAEGRPDDLYTARITKVGVDLGITTETLLSWAVFAPTVQIGMGDLSGNYAGVSASAAIGVGVGGNALLGGSQNSFALQPLSVQGQTGLSVAGGVQSLELRPGRF